MCFWVRRGAQLGGLSWWPSEFNIRLALWKLESSVCCQQVGLHVFCSLSSVYDLFYWLKHISSMEWNINIMMCVQFYSGGCIILRKQLSIKGGFIVSFEWNRHLFIANTWIVLNSSNKPVLQWGLISFASNWKMLLRVQFLFPGCWAVDTQLSSILTNPPMCLSDLRENLHFGDSGQKDGVLRGRDQWIGVMVPLCSCSWQMSALELESPRRQAGAQRMKLIFSSQLS